MPVRFWFRLVAFLLVGLSLSVVFALAEAGYRFRLWYELRHTPDNFRVVPSVYVEWDKEYGDRFKPNCDAWYSFVRGGKTIFGTTIARSNADGLVGRSTISQYHKAECKILVFGDSFTQLNQKGLTWPDILEDTLSRSWQRRVVVLNYAREGCGVLRMLDLAAHKSLEEKPDLIVLAPIGDDFTRDRWWAREIHWKGMTRWMLSSKEDVPLDYRYSVDEVIVNPKATREWCESLLQGKNLDINNRILDEVNCQYNTIREEVNRVRGFKFMATDRSYLYRRLRFGDPLAPTSGTLPRISLYDYSNDRQTVANCKALTDLNIPILLIQLPISSEVGTGDYHLTKQAKHLKKSLEMLLHTGFADLHELLNNRNTGKIDLEPFDPHPNQLGLQLYADAVAKVICDHVEQLCPNIFSNKGH